MIETFDRDKDSRIRIVSDIHLGHRKSAVFSPEKLLPLIDPCDVLICLGDTAETKPGRYQEDGLRKLEELSALMQEKGKKLFIIGGNHDPATPTRGAFMDHKLIFMMHGDALFKTGAPWGREYLLNKQLITDIIRKYPEAGKTLQDRLALAQEVAAAVPAILSQEKGNSKLINFLLHAAWPPSRPFRIMGSWFLYKHLVRKFARKYVPETRVVITGHMHRRSLFMADRKLFINTGAFFNHATPWIVDIHERKLTVSNVAPDFSAANSVASYSLDLDQDL